jgi:hypothetical protein
MAGLRSYTVSRERLSQSNWVRSQTGGLFAAIGRQVRVLFEAGRDSAPTRLHSGAQLLCILCAGGAKAASDG